jgi:hypothetical protein
MEEQREELIQQKPETVEGNKEQTVQKQSISVEEKINRLANDVVTRTIKNSSKAFTPDQEYELFDNTVRKITIERNTFLGVLNEAEEELKNLKWNDVQPRNLGNSHGFRGIYIVSFGNFIKAKSEGWIYRPTQSQYIKLVRRWNKKKQCENFANDLRYKLRGMPTSLESEAIKELKSDILDQIVQLRESV